MDNEFENIIICNTDKANFPREGVDLYENRQNFVNAVNLVDTCEVTIVVTIYNRIEKTRRCVDSIIKYTNIPYKLILIDNGSDNDIMEYLKSINYDDKHIIRITRNLGAAYATSCVYDYIKTKYVIFMPNDVVITPNSVENLLICAKSDITIGMVVPCSSNVSNLQDPGIRFSNDKDMQGKALKFNKSNPDKWYERLRLVTLCTLFKKEVIDIVGNVGDYGFYHDFGDDDISFRVRRAGYKTILCGDAWIHHDHDFRNMEDKDPILFQKSIEVGRQNFRDKYYGIDAWDDVNNYESTLVNMVDYRQKDYIPEILGIDVRCGTPLLEIKNTYRSNKTYKLNISSFTEIAKYYVDLKTICNCQVECDRVNYLSEYFFREQFDLIIIGKPVNAYSEPLKLLSDSINLLKSDGNLIIKIKNTHDINSFLNMLNLTSKQDDDYPVHWYIEDFKKWVVQLGCSIVDIKIENYILSQSSLDILKKKITSLEYNSLVLKNLMINTYDIHIRKNSSVSYVHE